MPHRPHAAFGPPVDRTLAIWRYLDVSRLLHVAQNRALHFARADTLGDPFEGSLSAATFAATGEQSPRIAKAWRLKAAVNCWHLSEDESVAMWDQYGRSNIAVAIRSTVQRLIDALVPAPQAVFLGAVSYIDYDRVPIAVDNALYPLLHKRRSYSHERELRAITTFPEHEGAYDLENNPLGILVPVDLLRLVEAIYIAPLAPAWTAETIRRAVADSFGQELPVRQSRLGEQPRF